LGAISFVSAPAFVALKDGGGLKWLCYEFGVPLGILFVILWIIPKLHKNRYISIYEYLEERFDRNTRTLVSILFQLGRGLATAVSILAGGLIISTATPLSTNQAILLIGGATILYDTLGGMRAVLISDVFQMLIILVGVCICGATALSLVGWNGAWNSFSVDRLQILDFGRWGMSTEGEYGFWPMAIGGIFLYASYYGCDQSQVQRELSVGSLSDVKKSLLLNAFGRFPVVLLYCLMGIFIGAVFTIPEHIFTIATNLGMDTDGLQTILSRDPDRMVPIFIMALLPSGIVGLVFVAIMSALMSSLDSAINSLSAVTMQDIYRKYFVHDADERHYLTVSKILTVFWGGFCILAALSFANAAEATRQTTIVLINAVGSLLYGPILAAFFIGMTTRYIASFEIKVGVIAGIGFNILLWRLTDISWLWWNATGFIITMATAMGMFLWLVSISRRRTTFIFESLPEPLTKLVPIIAAISIYSILIIIIAYGLQQIG
jgi:SSS family transporter